MDKFNLTNLLEGVRDAKVAVEDALDRLRHLPYEDIGSAKVDHHRGLRQGFPEVVLAEGKTPEQVVSILRAMDKAGHHILATRASKEHARAVKEHLKGFKYEPVSRTITKRGRKPGAESSGTILIVTAGTADIPVSEEAAVTARMMGNKVVTLYDVGVAGIHRLLDRVDLLRDADVIIVCAGMEGALASVVGGLVDKPVIGVPTSAAGYGASFKGVSALLGMLNSCAANVTVVNIDNGFGAAYTAGMICKVRRGKEKK